MSSFSTRSARAAISLALLVACSKPATDGQPVAKASASSAPPVASSVSGPAVASASAAPPASAPPAPTASAATVVPSFPVVEGTRFTFKGGRPDGTADTWTTTLNAKSNGLFQYQPHHDVINVLSKSGFKVEAGGITIVGESLEGMGGPNPPTRAIAFPFAAKASAVVPGLFPCTYTVVKKESVKVPAGKFDAWYVTLKDPANPEAAVWIAPETGIVKIKLPSGRIDELVSIQKP
jgi:hypothetical protein